MLRAALATAGTAVVLVCARAGAQTPLPLVPHRFEYVVEPGAVRCPEAAIFAQVIKSNLNGRDAIRPDAGPRFVVRVRRVGRGYVAVLREYDARGKMLSNPPDFDAATCEQAVKDAADMASVWAVDPFAPEPAQAPPAQPSPQAAPPAPKPAEAPSRSEIPPEDLPPVPPPQPAPAPKMPIRWRAGAMVRVDVRPQTAVAPGLSLDLGVAAPRFSVAAQFHAVPSAGSTTGAFDTSLLTGGLLVCLRLDTKLAAHPLVVPLCAIGEVGASQSQGGAYHLGHAAVFAGLGVHLSVEIPLGTTPLYLFPAVDLLYVVQGVSNNVVPPAPGTVSGGALGAGLGAGYAF